jgi:hypothetical protein
MLALVGVCALAVLVLLAMMGRPRVILDDKFRGAQLDPRHWAWGQTQERTRTNRGVTAYNVSQQDGALELSASAAHTNGWYVRQGVWLQSLIDLRKLGNARVEIQFSAQCTNVAFNVALLPRLPTNEVDQPRPCPLAFEGAPINLPFSRERSLLVLDLSSAANRVLVEHPDDSQPLALVNAPESEGCFLRLALSAASHAGADLGIGSLKLHRVRITSHVKATTAAGRVVDSQYRLPLADAEVSALGTRSRTHSDAAGLFVLPLPAGRSTLQAHIRGYSPARSAVPEHSAGLVIADFLLDRVETHFGDPVEVRDLAATKSALTTVVSRTNVYYGVQTGEYQCAVFRVGLDGEQPEHLASLPSNAGLAVVSNVVFGVATWLSQGLYEAASDGSAKRRCDLPTRWPRGLTFDGTNFWIAECDGYAKRGRVLAIDGDTGQVTGEFDSHDLGLMGLAWGRGRLWISSSSGSVFEVDPAKALARGNMKDGTLRQFRGVYQWLNFSDDALWAVSADRRLFRLDLDSPP